MQKIALLAIESIRIDGGTQMRAEIDQATVDEYAAKIDELPASVVYQDGATYWLADGFHRYHAHRKAAKPKMLCEIRTGTQRDAILFSVGANHAHGLRRTNADKRKAVLGLLSDDEWGKWSDRKISEIAQVSTELVADVRRSHLPKSASESRKYTTRQGTETTMQTANIGPSKPEADDDDFFPSKRPEPPKPAAVKDETGTELTSPKIADLYQRRQEITDLMTAVSKVRSAAERGAAANDPLFAHLNVNQLKADCGNVYRALRFARPYALCPYCGGRGCKTCRKTGLVGETMFKNYTAEDLKV